MDNSSEIARRLDEAMRDPRRVKPYSQYRLWKESGVPQATISRILKGNMPQGPEAGTLRALAATLGVSYNWLSEGDASNDSPNLVVQHLSDRHFTKPKAHAGVAANEEMPRPTPLMVTGPHWLTPQEWLLVSMHRRMDTREQQDLAGYAEGLPKIINPPVASNEPK